MKRKIITKKDIELNIHKDGFYPMILDVKEDVEVHITVDKHINASLYITYHGIDIHCNCTIRALAGSHCHILFWNEAQSSFQLRQQIDVQQDVELMIGYGDLSEAHVDCKINAQLREEGSQLHLLSACVSAQTKHYEMNCIHETPHTSSQMENYAVVKEHGDYLMKANGQIIKGAYQSTSLQATRVLTMSEQQKSEVIPLLLIDENDVKAGHATTVGQPDENQLYYLQTRGLSREQALSLLIIGYMMPITNVINQEELRIQLQSDIEEKVGYHA